MNSSRALTALALALSGLAASGLNAAAATSTNGITALSAKVSPDYVRTRLPDGSFEPEEYGFGEGGRLDGTFRDASMDKLKFLDIARALAGPLAAQKYVPARSLDSEKLLIVVFWGTTIVTDPLEQSLGVMTRNGSIMYTDLMQRDIQAAKNAKILGYDSEGLIQSDFGNFFTRSGMPGLLQSELVSELEENRYFVVLMAYDFQAFRKGTKHKLWETRFSISELGNEFDRALPAMTQYASEYFGQDSHGLLRKPVPLGNVRVGEPKALGEAEAPAK
jgi:hypothetical protein